MNLIVKRFFENGEYEDADKLVEELISITRKDAYKISESIDQKEISSATIPQYSSFDDGTTNMILYLRMSGNFGPNYEEVGKHYLETGHKKGAYVKYGENHSKLAAILGLCDIRKYGRKRVYLNEIGIAIEKKDTIVQHECFIKLAGKVPIVQYAIKNDIKTDKELEVLLKKFLSPTAAVRRRRNTWYIVAAIKGEEN